MSQSFDRENQAWNLINSFSGINADEVHLWRVRLDGVGYQDDRLVAMLSDEEQARAQRFQFDLHRSRFIRTHALSRMILARYTGFDPSKLAFGITSRGKPFLDPSQNERFRFNFSHSGDLMILGITVDLELGVDVEVINDQIEWKQIAANYFNAYELEGIARLPTRTGQLRAFYRVWTIKEAYLKARGEGLAGGLDKVIINLEEEDPEIFLELPGEEIIKRRWQAITFRPATGACGAVVAQRGQSPIKLIQFSWTG